MTGRPPGFVVRALAVEVGVTRIYNEAEWRDALVVVARGEIELEAVEGGSRRFGPGSVLCLAGLDLRALHSRGTEPAVLLAVSRAMSFRGVAGLREGEHWQEVGMSEHKVGTREEWLEARKELLEREKALTRESDEVARQRQELPWVRVEKKYTFDTDEGAKTLAELFAGRSQLLVYHLMFGPEYTAGACPTCSSIADGFDGVIVHLNHHDVTFLACSRAPIEKLQAYKRRMGWQFPWVSSSGSDFNFDFGVSFTREQLRDQAEYNYRTMRGEDLAPLLESDVGPIAEQAVATGTDPEGYMTEGPGLSAFALADGAVHHTYSTYARGAEFLMHYYPILDRAPKGRNEGDPPTLWLRRHDEYE